MKRKKRQRATERGDDSLHIPTRGKDRPTPERLLRGNWRLEETEDAGIRYARDVAANPIDDLEWRGVISNEQACAARDFEALYRAQCEVGGIRDSCTIWEPKGHDETDGPVDAKDAYRELCREIGMLRENRLQWVIIYERMPKPGDIGVLREDLNECTRFFKR